MSLLLFIIILSPLYFLPTIIASYRHHKNQAPIAILNTFFGWSVIGWFIALIWSSTYNGFTLEAKEAVTTHSGNDKKHSLKELFFWLLIVIILSAIIKILN